VKTSSNAPAISSAFRTSSLTPPTSVLVHDGFRDGLQDDRIAERVRRFDRLGRRPAEHGRRQRKAVREQHL
jgi:hypothetical protein